MNSAVHYTVAAQRHLDDLRASRHHALAAVPPKERRLSIYGAHLLGRVREQGRAAPLSPAAQR